MFLLIDCDNFFVSCERIFQPRLKKCPLIVLSNNDGCVVSRSYEAKAIPIPMGSPYFKIEKIFKAQGGIALSSNYELYADISQRVMALLRQEFETIETYSIDEAFARLPDSNNCIAKALHVRNRILHEIGISVSIGIAPSKTLCKIAAAVAKKKTADKIHILAGSNETDQILKKTDIIDIWGIGRHLNSRLNFIGIFTAYELSIAPLKMLRKSFSINLEKTAMELRGYPCLELEEEETAQSIVTSRSFEHEINNFEKLEVILSEFTASACLRLRNQNAVARGIVVFLKTNRFDNRHEQYNNSCFIPLGYPCCHTGHFIQSMKKGLKQIFRPSDFYKSAGVMLTEIETADNPQTVLFEDGAPRPREQKLMQAFDNLNHKLGKKSVFFGAQASGVRHYIKREFRSQSFTTSWDGLPSVK